MNYLPHILVLQTLLLACIVLIQLTPRARYTNKRRHYLGKINGTEEKIWDLEFLRVKLKAMREGFRMEHDKSKEMLDAYEKRLEAEKALPKQNEEMIKIAEASIAKLKPDVEQLVKQMEEIDKQLDGPSGVTESIDSYRVVVGMLKEEFKKVWVRMSGSSNS